MLKKRRAKKGSFDKEKRRSGNSLKDLLCSKGCGRTVKVDSDTEQVICWYCTATSIPPPEIRLLQQKKIELTTKRPKGWHFMKVFVDSDGNVFHEGTEQPNLKGTLPATPVKSKKTKAQKEEEKERKLVKFHEKKQKLKEKQNGEPAQEQSTTN